MAKIVDESETFLGPGYYEQKSQFLEAQRQRSNMTTSN
jgi:hypothetical protein